MAQSKKTAPTDAELFASLASIGEDDPTSTTTPQTTTKNPKVALTGTDSVEEDDPLADFNLTIAPRTSTSSRPDTPRLASAATSARTRSPSALRGSELYTPTTGSGRSSEEKAAAEAEAARSGAGAGEGHKASSNSQATPFETQDSAAAGGGWWGGLSAFANAAVKQAQGAVQELQKNEEAQRWAEQMRGNVGALRGLGGQLSSRALPTFTNLLHTLAPPISQHERLQIHITHDFVNYPSVDPLIYQTFSRVMSQVEGGDLLVIQRGSEYGQRRSSHSLDGAYRGGIGSGSGWGDGPWWRQNDAERSLGAVKGLVEGSKLVRVSAESYSQDFFSARGGIEEAAKAATEVLNESNPVRSSDIFLAIQAIHHTASTELFAKGSTSSADSTQASEADAKGADIVIDEEDKAEELIAFAVYLHDPVHSISFSSLSQPIPAKWAEWIDAKSGDSTHDGQDVVPQLPEEILEIIDNDGVDPREWVAEWMEEVLGLSVGIVAQRYVARRMGVGEGGIGRGKRREMIVEANAGEAARAV